MIDSLILFLIFLTGLTLGFGWGYERGWKNMLKSLKPSFIAWDKGISDASISRIIE